MRKRVFSFVLAVCLVLGMALGVRAAGTETARVVFEASQADTNGCFTMSMKVYNAMFKAFQFVLWYDPETVVPVDADGKETSVFSAFATKRDDGWMATVGTSIDTEKHLIDFTGYVNPGMSAAVDAAEETGKAVVGKSGLELFTFRFKKVGDSPVKLALASEDSGLPWQPYMPEGGAVVDAGISAPLVMELRYAMKWAVGEKLINGSNNALNPLGTASRAEVAQILMNFGQNVAK